jgi:hypothetical protein
MNVDLMELIACLIELQGSNSESLEIKILANLMAFQSDNKIESSVNYALGKTATELHI